ncbi:PREDICTED: uncharacterized protein LOC108375486 [Rhagoletis zephyria]|uniref:uncharacterized protein LOC108375486 n=1 Tax=Rhagoletis zephyria TaxID=28612 RepID=UPI0008118985|nr:PREDICTED: uncharacterized protein LOC108375486 [Rhagoletis zephyria]
MSINKTQLNALVNAMVENADIGRSFQKKNKEKTQQFWKDLNNYLNSLGPPIKSIFEWKKVWIDQKRYVRKKAILNAQNRKNNDGGKIYIFSALEQSILNLAMPVEDNKSDMIQKNTPSEIEGDTNVTFKVFKEEPFEQEDSFQENSSVCEYIGQSRPASTTPIHKRSRANEFEINPNDLLAMEFNVQNEMINNFVSGPELSGNQYNEVQRQLKDLKASIESLRGSQDRLLFETKRHHLEMERLKKIEMERNLELIKRQIEVQDWKILAAKRSLGMD